MDKQRLTWKEIQKKYPDQYVGLIDVKKDPVNLLTAIVYCSSSDTNEDDMHIMAYNGEISLEYTTLDDYIDMGAISL